MIDSPIFQLYMFESILVISLFWNPNNQREIQPFSYQLLLNYLVSQFLFEKPKNFLVVFLIGLYFQVFLNFQQCLIFISLQFLQNFFLIFFIFFQQSQLVDYFLIVPFVLSFSFFPIQSLFQDHTFFFSEVIQLFSSFPVFWLVELHQYQKHLKHFIYFQRKQFQEFLSFHYQFYTVLQP